MPSHKSSELGGVTVEQASSFGQSMDASEAQAVELAGQGESEP